jgi:Nucleotidyl transferase AbiEii toxin, Type IV TA system
MPRCFEPHFDTLPAAQRELWPRLRPLAKLSFVLYGGTAVALHLGHRVSLDFDFFRAEPLDKAGLRRATAIPGDILQDEPDTLALSVPTPWGPVKLSFFGGIGFGRVSDPLQTSDGALLVASIDDLMATKLKAILDRAEARDYSDIAAMLRHGASLDVGLGAFRAMFGGEPATVLRAIGFFEDGDLASLVEADRELLVCARDCVRDIPVVTLIRGALAVAPGPCSEIIALRQAGSAN